MSSVVSRRFVYVLVGFFMLVSGLYGSFLWQDGRLGVLTNLTVLWIGGIYVMWLSCIVDVDGRLHAITRRDYIAAGNRWLLYSIGFLCMAIVMVRFVDISVLVRSSIRVSGLLYLYAGPILVAMYRYVVVRDWDWVVEMGTVIMTPFVFLMMISLALFEYSAAFLLAGGE